MRFFCCIFIALFTILAIATGSRPNLITVCRRIGWKDRNDASEWKEFRMARSGVDIFLKRFPPHIVCEGPCPCPPRAPTTCSVTYSVENGKYVFEVSTNSTDVKAYRWEVSNQRRPYMTFRPRLEIDRRDTSIFNMTVLVAEKFGPDCVAVVTVNGVPDECPSNPDKTSPGLCGCDFDDSLIGHPCGTGLLGVCSAGVIHCSNGHQRCIPLHAPSAEVCNGLDDDCDGNVDNGIAPVECGTDEGECSAGTQVCVDGELVCQNSVGPATETCNGLDDDCNGIVDDIPTEACGSDVGACSAGTLSCSGSAVVCSGAVGPVDEVCNGIDDDCDGQVDEDIPQVACGSDVGSCRIGLSQCLDGVYVCSGSVGPAEEVCNGEDDDCDGLVDNGIVFDPSSCGSDVGECVTGTVECANGNLVCTGATIPVEETCNGKDDDCDGVIDNGIQSVACGSDIGECQSGMTECANGLSVCVGRVGPVDETCDGLDNNCDGQVDEGIPNCVNGTIVSCVPSPETCNELDDDCDNAVDETFFNKGQACQVTLGTCSSDGVYVCSQDGTSTVCSAPPIQDSDPCAENRIFCGSATTRCGLLKICGPSCDQPVSIGPTSPRPEESLD